MKCNQIEYSQLASPDREELHRAAYNCAFCELGLRWRWDLATFRELQRIPRETSGIRAYLERHQPHLLNAYEVGFLSDLIYETKQRFCEELSQRPDSAGLRDMERSDWSVLAGEAA